MIEVLVTLSVASILLGCLAFRKAEAAEKRAIDAEVTAKALQNSTHTTEFVPHEVSDILNNASSVEGDDGAEFGEEADDNVEKMVKALFRPIGEDDEDTLQ